MNSSFIQPSQGRLITNLGSRKQHQRVGAKNIFMKYDYRTINFLLNGWGTVTGDDGRKHWVYVPLWDPAPMTAVGKAILATLVIKTYMDSVPNAKVKTMLKDIVKEQARVVAGGFESAMDADGDWCGTKVPHRWPGGGPGPHGPIYQNFVFDEAFGEKLSAGLDAKAALTVLGKMLKNDAISKAAQMIEM